MVQFFAREYFLLTKISSRDLNRDRSPLCEEIRGRSLGMAQASSFSYLITFCASCFFFLFPPHPFPPQPPSRPRTSPLLGLRTPLINRENRNFQGGVWRGSPRRKTWKFPQKGEAFLLTVGAFLLTVRLLCLQSHRKQKSANCK